MLRRSSRLVANKHRHNQGLGCAECTRRNTFWNVGIQKAKGTLAALGKLHLRARWRRRLWCGASVALDTASVGIGLAVALCGGSGGCEWSPLHIAVGAETLVGNLPVVEGLGVAIVALRLLECTLRCKQQAEAARGPMRIFDALRRRIECALQRLGDGERVNGGSSDDSDGSDGSARRSDPGDSGTGGGALHRHVTAATVVKQVQGYISEAIRTADQTVLDDLNTELKQAELLEFLQLVDCEYCCVASERPGGDVD